MKFLVQGSLLPRRRDDRMGITITIAGSRLLIGLRIRRLLRRLCNRAVWLSHGSPVAYGEIESVLTAGRNLNALAQRAASA